MIKTHRIGLFSTLLRVTALLVLLLAGTASQAQDVRIVRTIDNAAVGNVFVFDIAHKASALSDSLGKVNVTEFAMDDTLVFRHPSYREFRTTKRAVLLSDFTVVMQSAVYMLPAAPIDAAYGTAGIEEDKKDVVATVETINAKEIISANAQTTADLLGRSASVLIQKSQQGGGSPILRGFEANRVLLVVDGVRMNNAIYRSGHLQNALSIDNSVLQQAEVIFGPSSVRYGSDALGGVLYFKTRDPKLSKGDSMVFGGNAWARYSSANNEASGHLDVEIGTKKFGALTSFTNSNFDDLRMGSVRHPAYPDFGKINHYAQRVDGVDSMFVNPDPNLQVGSGYNQFDFLQKFLYKPSDKARYTLNFQYSSSSDIPRYDNLNDYTDGVLRWAEWYYGPQERIMGAFTAAFKADKGLFTDAQITAAWQRQQESRHTRRFGSTDRTNRTELVDALTLNADFAKNLSERTTINYGLEAVYNDVTSSAQTFNIEQSVTSSASTRYPDGGAEVQQGGLYANVRQRFGKKERIIASLGLRYNYVAMDANFNDTSFIQLPFSSISTTNTAPTGSAGLVYRPDEFTLIRGMVATGFRAPNVDDNGKIFEKNNLITVPNNTLRPEYTYNGELTVSRSFFDKVLTTEVSAFYTFMVDAIVRQNWQLNGSDSVTYDGAIGRVVTNLNTNEAEIYGLAARIRVQANEALSFAGTYNLTYGRDLTDDVPLAHIPPEFGNLSGTYQNERLRADAWLAYNGWKYLADYSPTGTDNEDEATADGTPSWYTLNASLSYQVFDQLNARIGIENILNRHYKPFASGMSGPGRNIVATLRVAL